MVKKFLISGPEDITANEFAYHYMPLILAANNEYDAFYFMADKPGVEVMAQEFLMEVLNFDSNKVVVFHKGERPENVNPKIINTAGMFQSDDEVDVALTLASDDDIAFVRSVDTNDRAGRNLLRRHLLKTEI